MLLRVVTVAIWAAVAGVSTSNAQSLDKIGGPQELPPASYKGQMYVDSRGCVFLRAGLGGQVNWVARVNSARQVLCGYPPTFAAKAPTVRPAIQAVEPAVKVAQAPVVAPKVKAAPPPPPPAARVVASKPVVAAPKKVAKVTAPAAAAPAPVPRTPLVALAGVPVPGKVACPASAPVPGLYATANGGRVVLCTRGNSNLEGARAPVYAVVAQGVGNRVGAGIYPPGQGGNQAVSRHTTPAPTGAGVSRVVPPPAVPKGYKLAWKDDRLNPNRGRGTVAGQAQQDQIWTRDVPAVLVAQQPVRRRQVVVSSQSAPQTPIRRAQAQVSTKSEPRAQGAAPARTGSLYVQVGTFGVPANAEGAKARLRGAGLAVGTAKVSKGGKALQIVLAGPFADTGSAQVALLAARRAGFGDAFIR